MPKVWFIRHGESISNANLPTSHPADSELTPRGHEEARYVAQAFREKPQLLVVSPFRRARQTARPTIARFDPIESKEWPVHEFTYLAPHHYDGTTGEERRPAAIAYWERNDPTYKDNDEAESFAELMERVTRLTERLHAQTADFIVVFSHGLFLRALLWSLLANQRQPTPANMQRYSHFVRAVRWRNGAICEAHFHNNSVQLGQLDLSHLPEP